MKSRVELGTASSGIVNGDYRDGWSLRTRSMLVRRNGKYLQIRFLKDGSELKANMTDAELDAITTVKLYGQTTNEFRPMRPPSIELL